MRILECKHDDSHLINQAIDDGAQIISFFAGSEAQAMMSSGRSHGPSRIVAVAAAGNSKTDENDAGLQWWSVVYPRSLRMVSVRTTPGNGVTTAAVAVPLQCVTMVPVCSGR